MYVTSRVSLPRKSVAWILSFLFSSKEYLISQVRSVSLPEELTFPLWLIWWWDSQRAACHLSFSAEVNADRWGAAAGGGGPEEPVMLPLAGGSGECQQDTAGWGREEKPSILEQFMLLQAYGKEILCGMLPPLQPSTLVTVGPTVSQRMEHGRPGSCPMVQRDSTAQER